MNKFNQRSKISIRGKLKTLMKEIKDTKNKEKILVHGLEIPIIVKYPYYLKQ